MSVSDWSSDVCSSDLVAKYQQNQQIAAIDRTGTAAETDSSLDVAKIELGDPVGILTKIGRASCRERV